MALPYCALLWMVRTTASHYMTSCDCHLVPLNEVTYSLYCNTPFRRAQASHLKKSAPNGQKQRCLLLRKHCHGLQIRPWLNSSHLVCGHIQMNEACLAGIPGCPRSQWCCKLCLRSEWSEFTFEKLHFHPRFYRNKWQCHQSQILPGTMMFSSFLVPKAYFLHHSKYQSPTLLLRCRFWEVHQGSVRAQSPATAKGFYLKENLIALREYEFKLRGDTS